MGGEHVQYVGTSATMVGTGSFHQQRSEVAAFATKFFGGPFRPEDVIGETLKPATRAVLLDDPHFVSALHERISDSKRPTPVGYEDYVADPLSIWIEHRLGLRVEKGTNQFFQAPPQTLTWPN